MSAVCGPASDLSPSQQAQRLDSLLSDSQASLMAVHDIQWLDIFEPTLNNHYQSNQTDCWLQSQVGVAGQMSSQRCHPQGWALHSS